MKLCYPLHSMDFMPTVVMCVCLSQDERIKPMSESPNTLYDEDVLSDELPDVTLELAGRKLFEGPPSSATISFCSGLDSCPSSPAW